MCYHIHTGNNQVCQVAHCLDGRLESVSCDTLGVSMSTDVLINTLIQIDCGNWCVNEHIIFNSVDN